LRKNGIYQISLKNFAVSPKEEIIITKEKGSSKKRRPQVIEVVEQQKVTFHKNWFITIDGQKYYYTFDKKERVARYYKNRKLVNLDIVKEYRKKHKTFERLKSTGKHYVFKTDSKKKAIDLEFSDLGGMYFRMPRTDKNKVSRPKNPRYPYITLIKNGKKTYKKRSELTKEDRLLMMPPPPRPNASKEDLKKFKASMKAWRKRAGLNTAPKPQVIEVKEKKKKNIAQVVEAADLKSTKKKLEEYKKKNRIYSLDYNEEAKKYVLNTKRTKKEFQLLLFIYKNMKKVEREKFRSPTYIKNNINTLHKTLKEVQEKDKNANKGEWYVLN
jgi:hypothetical protein